MSVASEIPVKLENIYETAGRIAGVARRTELLASEAFSRECGAQVYLKMENLQRTGAFKIRGAYNKISRLAELPDNQRPLGVIAASAGNHAQGIASAAALSGFPATVVMPIGASLTKLRACKEMGAEVIQHGATLEEAATRAREMAKERELLFCHPYDDWEVITGQATLGLELLEDLPDVTTVLVPLGGGGLLSGVALAIKLQKPHIRVIGVQTDAVAPYFGYIQSGTYRPDVPGATTIADGIRVKSPGEKPSLVLRQYVDDVVTIDDGKTAETIVELLERTRTVVEAAGAVGLAALLAGKVSLHPGEKVIAVLSGGNIDSSLVGEIIDYGLSSSGRLFALSVIIPDKPGQLYKLLGVVAERGMNMRQVEHRRGELNVPVGQTEVVLQIECKDRDQQKELVEHLWKEGLHARILV